MYVEFFIVKNKRKTVIFIISTTLTVSMFHVSQKSRATAEVNEKGEMKSVYKANNVFFFTIETLFTCSAVDDFSLPFSPIESLYLNGCERVDVEVHFCFALF